MSVLPLISIITPCLNRRRYIAEAIDSVMAQNYPYIEHIVVDGQSTDGTLDVLKNYPRLKVISEPDQGLYDALNKGIRMASGEIIGLLNTDDFYQANVFADIVQLFRDKPRIEMICGGATTFTDNTQQSRKQKAIYNAAQYKTLDLQNLMVGPCLTNARFFRKQVFDKVGLFDLRYKYIADRDFLLRLAERQIRWITYPHVLYHYREHPGSLTMDPNSAYIYAGLKEKMLIAENNIRKGKQHNPLFYNYRWWHSQEACEAVYFSLAKREVWQTLQCVTRGWRYNIFWPLFFLRFSFKRFYPKLSKKKN